MAFDYGERRIGVAFANTRTLLATALTTLAARDGEPTWQELDTLVADWEPEVLVTGLPYNMDGSESQLTKKVRAFADQIGSRYELPVELVDERLTSLEASSLLRQQRQEGLRKRRLRREEIDSHAARLIAESWLEHLNVNNKNA